MSSVSGSGQGHEQHGSRYGVIVQSDAPLSLSTALVAPTSMSACPASFRPEIEIAEPQTRLGDYVGHLSSEEQWGVDLALETVLDLQ